MMMTFLDFNVLTHVCAPQVAPATMAALVRTESSFNPYAIGVVHGRLLRQPSNQVEAVAAARQLERTGYNYSVGLAQINRANFVRYGLTSDSAFEPCVNLAVGADILTRCFEAARHFSADAQRALQAGLSCYASGDFATGYRIGYVQRVVANAQALPTVPSIDPSVLPIPVIPDSNPHPTAQNPRTERSRDPPKQPDVDDAVVF